MRVHFSPRGGLVDVQACAVGIRVAKNCADKANPKIEAVNAALQETKAIAALSFGVVGVSVG